MVAEFIKFRSLESSYFLHDHLSSGGRRSGLGFPAMLKAIYLCRDALYRSSTFQSCTWELLLSLTNVMSMWDLDILPAYTLENVGRDEAQAGGHID